MADNKKITKKQLREFAVRADERLDELEGGKLDQSGGVMTGALEAQNNTDYTTKQVRNIYLIADGESMPGGSNGDICLVYRP